MDYFHPRTGEENGPSILSLFLAATRVMGLDAKIQPTDLFIFISVTLMKVRSTCVSTKFAYENNPIHIYERATTFSVFSIPHKIPRRLSLSNILFFSSFRVLISFRHFSFANNTTRLHFGIS